MPALALVQPRHFVAYRYLFYRRIRVNIHRLESSKICQVPFSRCEPNYRNNKIKMSPKTISRTQQVEQGVNAIKYTASLTMDTRYLFIPPIKVEVPIMLARKRPEENWKLKNLMALWARAPFCAGCEEEDDLIWILLWNVAYSLKTWTKQVKRGIDRQCEMKITTAEHNGDAYGFVRAIISNNKQQEH